MDAAVLHEPGAPRFGTVDDPTADDENQAVVEVTAAGLNPVDLMIAGGRQPDELPLVPGLEGVGWHQRRHVYFNGARPPHGSMAQRTIVDHSGVFDLPDDLDDGVAVALGIAGLAAWLSLSWRAALQPGETVLVLGATGVLGTIAVQAAKLQGAGQVVAAGRDADGLRTAAGRGADATVDLTTTDDPTAAFRDAAGGDLDVIVDPLWGEPALAALRAAGPFARLVQIGSSAASEITLSPDVFRTNCAAILGYTTRAVPIETQREAYATMTAYAADGDLTVDVERVPLRDVASAWQRQADSAHRKLVLVP
ncbi:NADPH2:quinone reductase [Pseudonocardia ammonioxydans]|uniref:NADPH2:quinone reductase n=1 Tax=Pseudonocardia ammonioxydans TaxID=260086 RepID=A0A1I5HKG0_PSUAM|nr:zinc-binding dehydrogenase [Pseudonocardia ammonioxydans]SFO48828.1 NADPH2:quinone reductase [Pseudonocardia ammonioxydans]